MAIDLEKLLANRRQVEPTEVKAEDITLESKDELNIDVIDRYGKCPSCSELWDGGNMVETLSHLDVFKEFTDNEILKLAINGYGYDPQNPKRFSRLVVISVVSDKESEYSLDETPTPANFMMCPSCGNAWDINSGKHLGSLNEARKTLKDG